MKIFKFHESENKTRWIAKIRECEWSAAKLLADILEQNTFNDLLGGGQLLVMADGDELVGFCTLTQNDCVKDDSLFPWIGFLFVNEAYRGHRYSQDLIERARLIATEQGHSRVYLATDHVGFYEKYGFTYLENRIDIYEEDSRIYYI